MSFQGAPARVPLGLVTPAGFVLVEQAWFDWFESVARELTTTSPPITTTVVLAKLTGGGSDGSLTIENGRVTAYVAPT